MAFNTKEQAIIQWGVKNGKPVDEIKSAVARYRSTGSPSATQPSPFDELPGGPLAALKDIPSDVGEAFSGSVDAVSRGIDNAETVRSQVEKGELSPLAGTVKTIGGGLKAGAEVVGQAFLGLGKLFTSPKTESVVAEGTKAVVQDTLDTEPVQALIQRYQSLSPDQQATIDGFLGTAEGLGTLLGLGPATRVASKGAEVAVSGAKEGLSVAGNAVRQVKIPNVPTPTKLPAETPGVTLARFFLRPTQTQAEALVAQRKIVDVADTAMRYGVWGRDVAIGMKASEAANTLWTSTVQPAVQSVTSKIYGNDILKMVESQVRGIKDPVRRADMREALKTLKAEYGSKGYSLETWQEIKSEIDEITPAKGFKGDEIVSPRVQLNHNFADAIRGFTYDLLKSEDIRRAYLDYANLRELVTRGAKTAAMRSGSPITSPYQLLYQTLENMTQPAVTGAGVLLDRLTRPKSLGGGPKSQGALRAADTTKGKPTVPRTNGGVPSPTTASKPSKAVDTSTGNAPIGKEGVSAQKAGTSGPFEGDTFYHATRNKFADDELQPYPIEGLPFKGVFFSRNLDEASRYVEQAGVRGEVKKYKLDPNAKIYSPDDVFGRENQRDLDRMLKWAYKNKYDAVTYKGYRDALSSDKPGQFEHTVVFNRDIVRTSSPSIPKELEPLAAEARKYKTAEEFRKDTITLYHATTKEKSTTLKKDGFIRDMMDDAEKGGDIDRVFFATTKEEALQFGDELLEVKVPRNLLNSSLFKKTADTEYTYLGKAFPLDLTDFFNRVKGKK